MWKRCVEHEKRFIWAWNNLLKNHKGDCKRSLLASTNRRKTWTSSRPWVEETFEYNPRNFANMFCNNKTQQTSEWTRAPDRDFGLKCQPVNFCSPMWTKISWFWSSCWGVCLPLQNVSCSSLHSIQSWNTFVCDKACGFCRCIVVWPPRSSLSLFKIDRVALTGMVIMTKILNWLAVEMSRMPNGGLNCRSLRRQAGFGWTKCTESGWLS